MASVTAKKQNFSLRAYRGDAKTLLAFNLADKKSAKDLAGFTIQCKPDGEPAYFIHNNLKFEKLGDHAQDSNESPYSSINAPIHKFRWVHVPGSVHQGTKPFLGDYTYTVTPRYFDGNQSLKPLDPGLSASATILVDGYSKDSFALGFTRGYTQSQAFVNHFGLKAQVQPKGRSLLFDTSEVSGKNAKGEEFTFKDEYDWLGFTAREKIFTLLADVVAKPELFVDVFAYDLNEPDLIEVLLKLAKQGRIRVILDNAALHHAGKTKSTTAAKSKKSKKAPFEDLFEAEFVKAAGNKKLLIRGKFGRYAHDKVFIVSKNGNGSKTPFRVLTGSTNFSVTGLYVNSNHILVYDDEQVAGWYAGVFEEAWETDVKKGAFIESEWSNQTFSAKANGIPKTDITFAPHNPKEAGKVLGALVDRIKQEGKKKKTVGSVLFAVMAIDQGVSPVYTALKTLHSDQSIFSYGISDSPGGISLYPLGKKTGVLVTGKPVNTQMPPPFNQVPNIGGVGHQIHHKFVVCGFNGDNPVVFCGSSNLAQGGETNNGDNLLAIYDGDVATVFAIEALLLVDHFDFLDRSAKPKAKKKASKQQAAVDAGWFLGTTDAWATKYFDSRDLHAMDRQLFA
jgi:hypothetical protein